MRGHPATVRSHSIQGIALEVPVRKLLRDHSGRREFSYAWRRVRLIPNAKIMPLPVTRKTQQNHVLFEVNAESITRPGSFSS